MDKQLTSIERSLAALQEDVAVIRSNYLTKEDLRAFTGDLGDMTFGMHQALIGSSGSSPGGQVA